MRQSYTVTVPEEPPAAAFPFLKQEMRRKGSMSGSVLVSTFVGLLINQAKVRGSARYGWFRYLRFNENVTPHSIQKLGYLVFIPHLLLYYMQSCTTHEAELNMLCQLSVINYVMMRLYYTKYRLFKL